MTTRRLMGLLLAWLFAASAHAACMDGGIGGTGVRADGGIGGTGIRAEADLTLFGVITGFGSICVNGIEVHYSGATPVALNGASALAIGQTVLVQASSLGETQAQATAIKVAAAVVGPVTAVDASSGIVHVLGQAVRIDASTQLGAGLPADLPRAIKPGEVLRVSGLATAGGTITATRVDRAAPGAPVAEAQVRPADIAGRRFVVQGYVGAIADGRDIRIGALELTAESGVAASLAQDQLVRLSGRNERGRLIVERAERLSSALNPRPERGSGVRPGTSERGGERGERGGSADRPDNSGRGSADRPDRADRPERPERVDRGGSDRPDRPDRSGRH
jgi:hypothetical protein